MLQIEHDTPAKHAIAASTLTQLISFLQMMRFRQLHIRCCHSVLLFLHSPFMLDISNTVFCWGEVKQVLSHCLFSTFLGLVDPMHKLTELGTSSLDCAGFPRQGCKC